MPKAHTKPAVCMSRHLTNTLEPKICCTNLNMSLRKQKYLHMIMKIIIDDLKSIRKIVLRERHLKHATVPNNFLGKTRKSIKCLDMNVREEHFHSRNHPKKPICGSRLCVRDFKGNFLWKFISNPSCIKNPPPISITRWNSLKIPHKSELIWNISTNIPLRALRASLTWPLKQFFFCSEWGKKTFSCRFSHAAVAAQKNCRCRL